MITVIIHNCFWFNLSDRIDQRNHRYLSDQTNYVFFDIDDFFIDLFNCIMIKMIKSIVIKIIKIFKAITCKHTGF